MTKKLARHVHVRHPVGGDVHKFAPGDRPPAWACELITNPKAWGDDDSPPVEDFYAAQTGAVPPADAGDQAVVPGREPTERPTVGDVPRGGRRAGKPNSPTRA